MTTSRIASAALFASLILVGACGGGEQAPAVTPDPTPTPAAPTATGPQTPDEGGKIIEIEMETDDQGNNVFEPANVEAKRGDVLRYKLESGVHNVHFLADSNPTMKNAPPPSAMLQLPGQTFDLKVTWDAGRYFYQCDPHALLGMVGYVTVK